MHSLCASCGERGHRHVGHPTEEEREELRERFRIYSVFGLKTRQARCDESHKWGFKPAVTKDEFKGLIGVVSDEEDDDDPFSVPAAFALATL